MHGRAILMLLVLVLTAAATVRPAPAVAAPPAGPPTWSDEFDGDVLDATRWSHRATGPRRDGFLTPDAVSVADGMLTMKTYTEHGSHYSGMISTHAHALGGFEQAYGYFEARMRFAGASGQWSAFWLQSPTLGVPLGDPETAGVEMDVVEHRVRCVDAPSPTPPETCAADSDVADRVQQALVWDGYGAHSRSAARLSDPLPGLADGGWHTWAVEWTPTRLTFYYDDRAIWSSEGPISRRSQYMILSSEVGASFAGAIPAVGYGTRETTTTGMQVDHVRVWAWTPPPSPPSVAPVSTGAPVLSGEAVPGGVLSCSEGAWTGEPAPTVAYQWLRNGAPVAAGVASYAMTAADEGSELTCEVVARNAAGTARATAPSILVAPARPTVVPEVRAGAAAPPPAQAAAVPSIAPSVADTAVRPRLAMRRSPRLRRPLAVTISCDGEPCRTAATATLSLGERARRRPPHHLVPAAGGRLELRLDAAQGAALRRALRARGRVEGRVRVTVVDAAANSETVTRRFVLGT